MASGTVDRPATQIDPLPPTPVPLERARVQRERITRTDMEACGTTAGCPGCIAIRSRRRAHSDLCRVRNEECIKTTPEGAERPDRRNEVLNEALAKKVKRNVRRREEIRSVAGELAVPQECKEGKKRQQLRAGAAHRGRQPCSCRDADTANFNDT